MQVEERASDNAEMAFEKGKNIGNDFEVKEAKLDEQIGKLSV